MKLTEKQLEEASAEIHAKDSTAGSSIELLARIKALEETVAKLTVNAPKATAQKVVVKK